MYRIVEDIDRVVLVRHVLLKINTQLYVMYKGSHLTHEKLDTLITRNSCV